MDANNGVCMWICLDETGQVFQLAGTVSGQTGVEKLERPPTLSSLELAEPYRRAAPFSFKFKFFLSRSFFAVLQKVSVVRSRKGRGLVREVAKEATSLTSPSTQHATP